MIIIRLHCVAMCLKLNVTNCYYEVDVVLVHAVEKQPRTEGGKSDEIYSVSVRFTGTVFYSAQLTVINRIILFIRFWAGCCK